MQPDKIVLKTLVTEQQIKERIKEIGKQITQDYQGKDLLIIGVLKGAWIYMADLIREIDVNCTVDFLAASSYGASFETSGVVTITRDISTDVRGKDIILVEDIVDSGFTLNHLKKLMYERGANSVRISTLLSKPSRRRVEIPVEYVGFEIPDAFVIGYGLDYIEKYRHLKDVCVVNTDMLND